MFWGIFNRHFCQIPKGYCFSVAKSCLTLCNAMNCSMPGFPVLHCLPEFAQTHVHWVSDAIQPSHPLSLPSPLTLNLWQHQGLFQWVSSLYQVAKFWSFSLSISPSNEYSGLISFSIDWFDLLAFQGTLKSLLQHRNSKAVISAYLWCVCVCVSMSVCWFTKMFFWGESNGGAYFLFIEIRVSMKWWQYM